MDQLILDRFYAPKPSLWGYYYTLPQWAREDNFVKNTMMSLEYHQPSMTLRQKEQALNLACSFLRPIEKSLMLTIAECAASNKIQLNMERGKQMLNEIQFREFDPEDYAEMDDGGINENYKGGGILDEEDGQNQLQAAMSVLNEDSRIENKRRTAQAELSIEDYKVEPMTSECLSDFLTLEANTDLSLSSTQIPSTNNPFPNDVPRDLPLNFYDNDDDFWTDYI